MCVRFARVGPDRRTHAQQRPTRDRRRLAVKGAVARKVARTGYRAPGLVRMAMFFDDLVVMARGEAPDPIPNSAVKTLSADGTAS